MRQRLIYILKHNPYLLVLYKVIMSSILKIFGLFQKTDKSLILFLSFMGKGFNDSPKTVYDYIHTHDEYAHYKCIWAFEHPEDYPKLNTVKIDSFQYFRTALSAKYWVTNTNIERGLNFKKNNQVYLNTWHGIALKYIGNDVAGRHDYNFKSVNYLCVSGDYDERVFRSAFRARKTSYLLCGLPRNDELWHVKEEHRIAMKEKLMISQDKIVILYAPTWRESKDDGRSYQISPPVHFDFWKKELGDNYNLLFRAHHQTTEVLGLCFDEYVRDVSNYPEVNDLLIAADILVTDYSSIAFDYSILCRPILCFAYDYDTYLMERGTYFEIDEKYPSRHVQTEIELLQRIKTMDYAEECRKTRFFRDEFIQYGGQATAACVKSLLQ